MQSRAAAAEATGERIIDAAVELFWDEPTGTFSLADVARRAGVTVQTVIRRFGGRDGLIAAALRREIERTRQERDQAPVNDVAGAVTNLVDHYEQTGARVLRMLADEHRSAAVAEIAESGRALHRAWCAKTFAAALAERSGVDRRRRLAQLVAVCDVYMWKLLRRDAGLSRRQTEQALVELLMPIVAAS